MSQEKKGLFILDNGTSVLFTFILVSSLFLLWGVCNGLIDTMDKHFQDELHLSKSQSAWVQFAHYLGYFLMSIPAGWLATRLGYKGGIVIGLLIVACGGFWFVPATHINDMVHTGAVSPATAFTAYLAGVCAIAAGLTFLETIANPYTTVLGPKQFAATRINLAQSCNGIGWIAGPIIAGKFFYSKNASGQSTGSQTLYIPYLVIGITVVVLAVVFFFSSVPDVKSQDEYHLEEKPDESATEEREIPRGLVYLLLLLNSTVLIFACGMILWVILQTVGLEPATLNTIMWAGGAISIGVAALLLIPQAREIKHHSVWSHPHFTGAVVTQFFYVAAQAGIFSFFINYMTEEVPALPNWATALPHGWLQTGRDGFMHISEQGASQGLLTFAFCCFLFGRISGAGILKKYSAHKVLGIYALTNVLACLIVFLKLGWISVAAVFFSYFFMSIMFPTIFALGIHGLGARAKKASSYIVMAIMGGAILPKLMGLVADKSNMSRGFIVPLACFVIVALYGFNWPRFSKAESLSKLPVSAGH